MIAVLVASGSVIMTLVAHSVLDGFTLGVAFQVDTRIGVAVAVAIIAHDFADGFNTYTLTTLHGNDTRRGLLLLAADAVAPLVGASPVDDNLHPGVGIGCLPRLLRRGPDVPGNS